MPSYSKRAATAQNPQAGSPQTDGGKGFRPGTRVQRECVKAQITDLFAGRDCRNYTELVSKRLGIPVATVSHVMAGLILEYERRAACLETALANARSMAAEAAAEAWEEAS